MDLMAESGITLVSGHMALDQKEDKQRALRNPNPYGYTLA
jgi:hypothetical protein